MPMIHELCGSVPVALNIQIADRIIDSLNALSTAKHKRLTLEQERIPSMLWFIQYTLSTIMFSGVLLIVSGSLELNIFMCFCTSVMIGVNSLFIADMDMPYIGYLSINKEPLLDLVRDMQDAVQSSEQSSSRTRTADDGAELRSGASSNPLEKLATQVLAFKRLNKDTNNYSSRGSPPNINKTHSTSGNISHLVRQAMRPAMKPANTTPIQIYSEVGNKDDDMVVTNI